VLLREFNASSGETTLQRTLTQHRCAQELVWANRMKKIAISRDESFMGITSRSGALLIEDWERHLAHFGLGGVNLQRADTLKRSMLSSGEDDTEWANVLVNEKEGKCTLLFNPSLPITPSNFVSLLRTIAFESSTRNPLQTQKIIRFSFHANRVGDSTLLIPLSIEPFDDTTEIFLLKTNLRWRAQSTGVTPPARQPVRGQPPSASKGKAPVAPGRKSSAQPLATTSHFAQPTMARDGLGALRLTPIESSIVLDPDTSHWDDGFVEFSITGTHNEDDLLVFLPKELQSAVVSLHEFQVALEMISNEDLQTLSLEPSDVLSRPSSKESSRPSSKEAAKRSGGSPLQGPSDPNAKGTVCRDTKTVLNGLVPDACRYLFDCEPPFRTAQRSHRDLSLKKDQGASGELQPPALHEEIEKLNGVPRKLFMVDALDPLKSKQEIGSITFSRVEKAEPPGLTSSNAGTPAPSESDRAQQLSGRTPCPRQLNFKTTLRIDFFPSPSAFDRRIDVLVLRNALQYVAFLHDGPVRAPLTVAVDVIVSDPQNPGSPGTAHLTVDLAPALFWKPQHLQEPIYYPQRSALEGKSEFLFQHMEFFPPAEKERFPFGIFEVFPVSGWVPRDQLNFKFTGSPFVLSTDGQVIAGKDIVCRGTQVQPSLIRFEITKECKGATFQRVAQLLALIVFQFDNKDLAKDINLAPTDPPQLPSDAPPPIGGVPQHDRLVALQFAEQGLRDSFGRQEYFAVLQRISPVDGMLSEQ
jgi:hypothetical protein